ncbi:hypothetical protein P8C59_004490 [Phyllachora maydis]|uniref:Uncharacterized protein n=1 Tax=Phyllachora maydis TaxID=1825666 RepID=A0AAD9I2H4_9PEZI|nr:hypothetical protein P8C59_004490 [Phyllachora maydis]
MYVVTLPVPPAAEVNGRKYKKSTAPSMAIDTSVRPTVREPVLSTGHVTMSKLHSHNRRKSNKLSVVEAIQPVPVSPLKMQQLGLGQGQGKGALLPTVAVADDAEPMTASQLLGLDGDVDLLLSPELDLLADLDELAYEYVMDPEPWEMFVDAELNRLTYYAPMPLSPASPALSRSSGRSSSAGCSLAGADSDLDSDSDDPSSPTDEQPGALAAYWESVASTAAFTAPRIHICHVLQHYLASCASDPVLAAATAAAALDQGYADLLLPGPRNGRARTAELKTGRRMAGYLWALWTMVVELARKGADQDVLALLLHKLRRLPGRSFAQWKDPAEGGKCPEAAATTSDAKGVQMPAFRSVRAWRELARLEEVVHRAWQCSAHTGFFDTPSTVATTEWVNFTTFVGRLFADGFLGDWALAASALDNALDAGPSGPRPRRALHVVACNTLVAAAFVEAAGPALLAACVRGAGGLALGSWTRWVGAFDELAALEHEGTLPALCAREKMLELLEEAVETLPRPSALALRTR